MSFLIALSSVAPVENWANSDGKKLFYILYNSVNEVAELTSFNSPIQQQTLETDLTKYEQKYNKWITLSKQLQLYLKTSYIHRP